MDISLSCLRGLPSSLSRMLVKYLHVYVCMYLSLYMYLTSVKGICYLEGL